MRRPRMGPGVTVFVLFFLLALIEALRSRDWALVGVFVGLGALSLIADSVVDRGQSNKA